MRLSNHFALLLLTLVGATTPCNSANAGPISPSRGLIIRPNWAQLANDSSEALPSVGTFGSVFHGFKSASDNFGWAIDIGAIFELWRWNERHSLIGLTDMELTARTDNDISFNPKGGFWEEGLLYASKGDALDWEAGYLHRCRHDIDNGDTTEFHGIPAERTLIYGSLSAKLLWHPIDFAASGPEITPWLSGDLYVFREEYRQPSSANSALPNFHNILFSLGLGASFEQNKGPGWRLFARCGLNLTAFGVDGSYLKTFSSISKTTLDGLVELGLRTEGKGGRFEIYLGTNSFNDDGSNPLPTQSTFFSLGVRLSSRELIE